MDELKRKGGVEATHLLEEGARSYLDAIVAFSAFRREVCNRCRTIIAGRLAEFGGAIGDVSMTKEDVRDWGLDETDYAFLGVKVQSLNMRTPVIIFYFGLCWEGHDDERWFGIETGFWVQPRLANRLMARLKKASEGSDVQIEQDDGNFGIYQQLNPDKAGSFEDKLGELFGRWISLGEKCGGILKLLAENS